jgi:glucose-1-phosphate thymidylyltransferase
MERKKGEFTITDINRRYISQGKATLRDIDDYLWLDCGTADALLEASQLAADGKLSPKPCNIRDGD